MFLAIDPGRTTGYATFKLDGELTDFGQIVGVDPFTDWLNARNPKPSLIICETFKLDPNVPQGGSDMEASQVIGRVGFYGRLHGIDIEWQRPAVKPVGYGYAGIKQLSKRFHDESHQYDAIAHGWYYLVQKKIKKTAIEQRLERQ